MIETADVSRETVEQAVRTALARTLNRPEMDILSDSELEADLELDSLALIRTSIAIEEQLRVAVPAGDPGATADAVSGGWLRTGDLGYEAAGLLFVTGRQKEIIIRGGQNLVPAVLEEIASSVEGVRPGGVAAVGVRSESRQSELVCVVAETKLEEPRHREIAAQIRSALRARGVSPDRVVLVPPRSLPRTTSGKIRRLELARRLAAEATPP